MKNESVCSQASQGVWGRIKADTDLQIYSVTTKYLFSKKEFLKTKQNQANKKKPNKNQNNKQQKYTLTKHLLKFQEAVPTSLLTKTSLSSEQKLCYGKAHHSGSLVLKLGSTQEIQEKTQSLKRSKSRKEEGKTSRKCLGTSLMSL